MTNETSETIVLLVADDDRRWRGDEAPDESPHWDDDLARPPEPSPGEAAMSAAIMCLAVQPRPCGLGRWARAGMLAAVAAAGANLLVFVVVREVVDGVFLTPLRGPTPPPLALTQVVAVSAVPAFAATVLLGLVARLARPPRRAVRVVAVVVALISLAAPLPLDGVPASTRVALIGMLLVATAVSLGVLGAAALGQARAGAATG